MEEKIKNTFEYEMGGEGEASLAFKQKQERREVFFIHYSKGET